MRKIGLLIMAVFMLLLASCGGNKGYKIFKEDIEKGLEESVELLEDLGYEDVKLDIDWGKKEVVKVEEDDKVIYFYKVEYSYTIEATPTGFLPDVDDEDECVVYFCWEKDSDTWVLVTEDAFEAAKEA